MHSFVPKDPIYYLSKNQLFRERKWRKKANPIYLRTCEFFGATLIDRTGCIETGIPFQVIDPISLLAKSGKSFEDICAQRAAEISAKAGHQTIRVLWSGGIDSTVALISLIREMKKEDQLVRLKILLSKESILEFPSFFQQQIENKLAYQLISDTIYDHIQADEINVTGEHGDQLFGSDKLKYAVETQEAFRPYQEVLDYFISRKLGTEKHTKAIIDYVNPQLAYSPVEIETYYDYLWWMNFSMKWQNVSLRLLYGLNRSHHELNTRFFHFFQHTDFQNWSISNHDKKIKRTWNSYKYIAKKYIHDFHPDHEYLLNKEKEPSLKEVLVSKKRSNFSFPFKFIV
ncbi:MAG: hypothetical protein R2828_03145 [Saprospiraceae bacterium]